MKPMDSIDLVREFHETYEQPIAEYPNINDEALSMLRVTLLAEEVNELAAALGLKVVVELREVSDALPPDEVLVLDALTDIQYVLDGAYLSLGYHYYKDAALEEVQRSNMSKLGEDGKPIKRADGKVLKGPSFSEPDFASVMRAVDKVYEDL